MIRYHACDALVPTMPEWILQLHKGERYQDDVPIMYAVCGGNHTRQQHMAFQDAIAKTPDREEGDPEYTWYLDKPPTIENKDRWAGIANGGR